MKIFISISLAFLFSTTVYGAQSQLIHQTYISSRVMARGGTITSLPDTFEAMMFNPAGLARLEKGTINMFFNIAGTPSILPFFADISGAGSSSTAQQNALLSHLGDHFASRVGLGAIWARPSWGVAVLPLDFSLELDVQGGGGLTIGLQGYQDTAVVFAKAWNLNDEKTFNLGVAPKIVYRAYFEKDLTIFDLTSNPNSLVSPSDAQEGLAMDMDFGFLYTVKAEGWVKYLKPTIGFAIRNLLDGGFKNNFHLFGPGSATTQTKLERRFDIGVTTDLPKFAVFVPRASIELRDLGSRYASFKKCLHLGGELFWKAFNWLEGSYLLGFSEGYISAGVSGQLTIFRIDLSTYSEEIGTATSPRESRRWMAKLSMDF